MIDGTAVDTRQTKIMYVAEATAHGGRDGYRDSFAVLRGSPRG